MFKDVLRHMNASTWAEIGLVIFMACFAAIVVWVWTRPKKRVDQWSQMPLSDDPVEKRPTGNDSDE